eukprot:4943796-Prymnesium_polylepis.1
MDVAERARREAQAAEVARNRTELERAADLLVSAVARDAAAGQEESSIRRGVLREDPQARQTAA